MMIDIKEKVEVIRTIEIDIPYYYTQDLSGETGEYIIYGEITETTHRAITYKETDSADTCYEIEESTGIEISDYGSFFAPKYTSTKEQFLKVKESALKFLTSF